MILYLMKVFTYPGKFKFKFMRKNHFFSEKGSNIRAICVNCIENGKMRIFALDRKSSNLKIAAICFYQLFILISLIQISWVLNFHKLEKSILKNGCKETVDAIMPMKCSVFGSRSNYKETDE